MYRMSTACLYPLCKKYILAESNINTSRVVPANCLSASRNKLMRSTTTLLRTQSLLRRRTRKLFDLALFRRHVIHTCMICFAPTIVSAHIVFTSSSSLKHATNQTALLRQLTRFRRPNWRNCFVFKTYGSDTNPPWSCGDNLQADSSTFTLISVLSPTVSGSRTLCHLQVADDWLETKIQATTNNNKFENKVTKTRPENGPSDSINMYDGHHFGDRFLGLILVSSFQVTVII